MQFNNIAGIGTAVSALCLGCWSFAGDMTWGPQHDRDSIETVHAALDAGVNFFDTAEAYGDGRSEQVLGRALKGRRHQAVVATKASPSHHTPNELRKSLEKSLQNLDTDFIDLYQLHWPSRETPFADTVGALEDLRREGLIRAWGVSNFGLLDLSAITQLGAVATDQMCYSLLFRSIETQVIPLCRDRGTGILCYSPLAQGLLTGKYASAEDVPPGRQRTIHFSCERLNARHGQPGHEALTFETLNRIRAICDEAGLSMAKAALLWPLMNPQVTAVIGGARNAEQMIENARDMDKPLPDDVYRALDEATEELRAALGNRCDMWADRIR